jgi:hypothetical protein
MSYGDETSVQTWDIILSAEGEARNRLDELRDFASEYRDRTLRSAFAFALGVPPPVRRYME